MLNQSALIVCEYEYDFNFESDLLEVIKEKKYGYKCVKIYKLKDKKN